MMLRTLVCKHLQRVCCYSTKSNRFVDPKQDESIPVFQYAPSTKSKRDTKVYTWGLAEHGALGEKQFLKPNIKSRRPVEYMHRPYRLAFAEEHEVIDVACGYGFTVFAVKSKEGDCVYGTGLNSDSQIGEQCVVKGRPLDLIAQPVKIPVNKLLVQKVACGRAHTVLLNKNGQAFTLGHNGYGQCGRPIVNNEDYTRQTTVNKIPIEEAVRQIVCGQDHSIFVSEKGSVYSCGWGADGQTGLSHYNNTGSVGQCKGDIEGSTITKVSCSADCVLALDDKGHVFGWGNSEYGQLSMATSEMQLHTPRHLHLPTVFGRIVDITATGTACMILNDSGQVFVWGYGILGKGPLVEHSAEPTEIPATLFGRNELNSETKVVSIYGGISQLAAVTNNGDLYIWGRNRFGSLGLGHLKDQFFPIKVCVPGLVQKISLGVDHCAAMCKSYL